MEPISSTDRLVLILREKLAERARLAGAPASRASQAVRPAGEAATGINSVHALAAVEGIDDHQLGRALIQSILSEELGPDLINEAKFQQVVDRVTDALEAEPSSSRLLTRMLAELRASAR